MPDKVWDTYWKKQWAAPDRDEAMNYLLAIILWDNFGRIRSRPISSSIEMGAGSGRASRYLNLMGAMTGILDVSPEAIAYCRYVNKEVPHPVAFYLNDIFEIDHSTIPVDYDLCWNAGVLEHFSIADQKTIIEVMLKRVHATGFVVVFTPYSGSLFYRVGKFLLEKMYRFPYGEETPVHSMKPALPDSARLVEKEISIGFLILIFNGFKALSYLPLMGSLGVNLNRFTNQIAFFLLSKKELRDIGLRTDRLLSFLFGGYLLMSIIEKKMKDKSLDSGFATCI